MLRLARLPPSSDGLWGPRLAGKGRDYSTNWAPQLQFKGFSYIRGRTTLKPARFTPSPTSYKGESYVPLLFVVVGVLSLGSLVAARTLVTSDVV